MSNFPEMEYKASGDLELVELAPGETSLDFPQKIYRSASQPIARRMRAASIALPFEHPKLGGHRIRQHDRTGLRSDARQGHLAKSGQRAQRPSDRTQGGAGRWQMIPSRR